MAHNNDDDHWNFLDEIEAPMWVDLAFEAENKSLQSDDDEWFNTSHQFHQLSAFQLKSMFSQSGVCASLANELQGPVSPKLASSVSRSRGKDYKSKVWRDISVNKPHPVKTLNQKSTLAVSGPRESIKPKLSFVNAKGTSKPKTSLIFSRKSIGIKKENYRKQPFTGGGVVGSISSSLTDKESSTSSVTAKANYRRPTFTSGDVSKSKSSSLIDKTCDSNTSTVTSDGIQQKQLKNMGASSRLCGDTGGLLSTLKMTIRKSYTTRPPLRVELNSIRRQSRDYKSSGSKSSVGSSSMPGHHSNHSNSLSSTSRRSKTPDSKHVTQNGRQAENNPKVSNMCRTSIVKVHERISNSRKVGISNVVAKPSHQELVISKVNYQNPRAKASMILKERPRDLSAAGTKAGEKMRVGGPNRMVRAGKENASQGISSSQKHIRRNTAVMGVNVRSQKLAKEDVSQKGDKTGLVTSKAKLCSRNEGKIPAKSVQRVHFR